MADTDMAAQQGHLLRSEHVTDQSIALVQINALTGYGGNAGCVLPPVLQDGESVIQRCGNIRGTDNSEYSAHKKTF
jgi:hypothetical protein